MVSPIATKSREYGAFGEPTAALDRGATSVGFPQAVAAAVAPRLKIVVIGGGPAGLRVAQELLRTTPYEIVVLSEERWTAYNRVKLTPFLAGEVQLGQVYLPDIAIGDAPIRQFYSHRAVAIDTAGKTVRDQMGGVWPYDKLILATGSRPRLPGVPGINLPGVFIFRSLDHAEQLIARSIRSRRIVVIGGGLLGLEAARGMAVRGAHTTVIEHESRLMARQLDSRAGALLKEQVEALGISVRVGAAIKEIVGIERVEGIRLNDDTLVPCDTVIACTGTQPNMELARDAGLVVHRGIVVDAQMRTSAPDIYAVGECAEFNGLSYGLVGPGLEQAAVAASHIAGGVGAYNGSVATTKLKVLGVPVFSVGDINPLDTAADATIHAFETQGAYRCLVVDRGRLAGALGIGEWPTLGRIQEAVTRKLRVWPWQLRRFRSTGELWESSAGASVLQWPAAATVCNCTGVTRGQIGTAIAAGCTTFEKLQQHTSASTVCGSCQPLLQELLGADAVPAELRGAKPLLAASVLALLLVAGLLALGPIPYTRGFAAAFKPDQLWIDGTLKQISGFTMLGLSAGAAVLSLRKRWPRLRLGDYAIWRVVHACLGAAILAVLVAHTGLHLGSNLNAWLLASFLAVSSMGVCAGGITALERRIALSGALGAWKPRNLSVWLHILACWPLPLLLIFHLLSVYFY